MKSLVTIDANSRHLRLARRALRAAITHLRNARGLTSMPRDEMERVRLDAISLERVYVANTLWYERQADTHLEKMRRGRR